MAGRSIPSSIRLVALACAATLLLSGCAIVSRVLTAGDPGGPTECAAFRVVPDVSGAVDGETLDATVAIVSERLRSLGIDDVRLEVLHPDVLTVSAAVADETSWRTAIMRPGVLTFVDVPPAYDQQVLEGQPLPPGMDATPILDGSNVVTAELSADQLGKPAISLSFDEAGAAAFDAYAADHQGSRFAIVVDGVVQSAPIIRAEHFGGEAQISGLFTDDEARDLVAALASGPLPTALTELPAGTDGTCATPVGAVE